MSISPTIETAELLARKAEVSTREVDFRRELGIVFGDAVIFALVVDIYHGKIQGKDGYLWKVAEPIVEKYKDVIDRLDPATAQLYADKTIEEQTTAHLLAQDETVQKVPQG